MGATLNLSALRASPAPGGEERRGDATERGELALQFDLVRDAVAYAAQRGVHLARCAYFAAV